MIQAAEDEQPRALVNPVVVDRSEETEPDDEGCLSMQGVVVEVERPVRVRVEARPGKLEHLRQELVEIQCREQPAGRLDEHPETLELALLVVDTLERGDVASWNDAAREDRRALLESDVAGGPVHELRLTVPNRPGIVAQVAVALGKAGVNIVDMALAPAPDMRSGAMTLWIAGDGQAARAAELIAELGFPVAEL